MSLNVGEANNVFALLSYLLPALDRQCPPEERVTEEMAQRAAAALADAAHKALSAGPFGSEVRRAWRKHDPGPRRG